MKNTKWLPDYDLYNKASNETLSFIHEEGKLRLEHTISTGDLATTRAYKLLTVFIPIFLAAFYYLITVLATEQEVKVAVFTGSVFAAVGAGTAIFILVQTLLPRDTYQAGIKPSLLFKESIIGEENETHQMSQLLYNQISNLEERIKHNDEQNAKRAKALENAIKVSILFPVGAMALFALLYGVWACV